MFSSHLRSTAKALGASALLLLASGCTESAGSDPRAAEDPKIIRAPGDFSGNESATPHVHDYWRGQTEVELFSGSFALGTPTVDGCDRNIVGPNSCFGFAPQQGQLVNPGTQWLNVTIDWQSTDGSEVELYFGWSGADQRTGDSIQPVAPGEFYSFRTNDTFNDPPHASASRWTFLISLETDAAEVSGHVTITIARPPGPLAAAPPHPDHWGGKSRLLLMNDEGDLCTGACPGGDSLPPAVPSAYFDGIVPPFAARMQVDLWFNSSTPSQAWFNPRLSWRGADQYQYEEVDVAPNRPAPNHVQWKIDLEPRHWDSPYVNVSAWQIALTYASLVADELAAPSLMQGDFQMEVAVERDPT